MNKLAYVILTLCVGMNAGSANAQASKESMQHAEYPLTYPVVTGKGDAKKVVGEYTIPSDTSMDKEENAAEIRYGQRLLNETARLLPNHVGDALNCNSCHIAAGKVPGANPYINTYNNYPRYMSRPARVFDLTDRINGCFRRSMNGTPLARDSKEMHAMIAYIKWLGQGVPKGQRVDITNTVKINTQLTPDPQHGLVLYQEHCASCHGYTGEGKYDAAGNIAFPPLWGEHSFNVGAGTARTYKAAAFIKAAMPMGVNQSAPWGQGKVLSDQDAVDIAQYFTHQARPDFPAKVNDWSKGGKPKDARY